MHVFVLECNIIQFVHYYYYQHFYVYYIAIYNQLGYIIENKCISDNEFYFMKFIYGRSIVATNVIFYGVTNLYSRANTFF